MSDEIGLPTRGAAATICGFVDADVPHAIRQVLTGIAVGADLSSQAFADAFDATVELEPPVRDVVLGSLLTAVMARGPAADHVEALLRRALAMDGREPAEVISGGDRPVSPATGMGPLECSFCHEDGTTSIRVLPLMGPPPGCVRVVSRLPVVCRLCWSDDISGGFGDRDQGSPAAVARGSVAA
jgi:hypothetical protein